MEEKEERKRPAPAPTLAVTTQTPTTVTLNRRHLPALLRPRALVLLADRSRSGMKKTVKKV